MRPAARPSRPIARVKAMAALAVAIASSGCALDSATGTSGTWGVGTTTHTITPSALTRSYVLHVPARRPTTKAGTVRPYPLVILLHGSSGSGDEIRNTTQMDVAGEDGRFVVAYPNGVQGAGGLFSTDWNAGMCCGAAARENVDDVGFIAAAIADISKNLAIDKTRIYVAGFSDGARMAYHLACQLAPTIAAIGVVSGSLTDDHCVPTRPVAVIAIHGTSDTQVPYDEAALTPVPSPPVGLGATLPLSVQFWLSVNGCGKGVASRPAADVLRASFVACKGADMEFYTIQGGSHAWPGDTGGSGSLPPMSELKATAVITQFFFRQVRR